MENELGLREIIEILLKQKWLIITVTALAMLTSGIISFFVLDTVYQAETMVNIKSERTNVPLGLSRYLDTISLLPTQDVNTIKQSIVNPDFIDKVVLDMQLDMEQENHYIKIINAISVKEGPANTIFILQAQDSSPALAAKLANSITAFLVEDINVLTREHLALAESQLRDEIKNKDKLLEAYYKEDDITMIKNLINDLQKEIDADSPVDYKLEIRLGLESIVFQKGLAGFTVEHIETMLELEKKRQHLEQLSSIDKEQNYATVIAPASPPSSPAQPVRIISIAVAAILGLMLSVFLVLFQHHWMTTAPGAKDQKVKNS